MRRFVVAVFLALVVSPASSGPIPGHHLPTGAEQAVREQQVDITRLTADLTVDMKQQTINGSVTVAFVPLQAGLDTLNLDAADLDIDAVELVRAESSTKLDYTVKDRMLRINLPAALEPDKSLLFALATTPNRIQECIFSPKRKRKRQKHGTTARAGGITTGCPCTTTPMTVSAWIFALR